MSLVQTTFAAIRARCPFSTVRAKGPEEQIPQLADVSDEVRSYQRAPDFFTSSYYMRLQERANYHGAPMELRLFVWKYMRALRNRGLPFYVHTCYRDPRLQAKLREDGFSNLASGAHQRSAAVDIVCAIDHWDIPKSVWYYVGTLGESVARGLSLGKELHRDRPLKIEWGGRWQDPWDPAHWQLSDWRRRREVIPDEPVILSPYSDKMRLG